MMMVHERRSNHAKEIARKWNEKLKDKIYVGGNVKWRQDSHGMVNNIL
jgi:hypothetical protein